jgi:type IV pilus assembly protein PilC
MPAYRYRAVDFTGRIARGSVAAANEWELAQNLHQAGLELIEASAQQASAPRRWQWRAAPRLAPEALARFASQMSDLLRAGIPFPESLQDLTRAAGDGGLRDALADIHRAVHHGSTIAEAFARHPRVFPDIFIAILAAGEASGDLTATFAQLARYANARATTIGQLRRAVRYPLFLVLVTAGVLAFMVTMVIPPIIQFLGTFGRTLPLMTRILIGFSDALVHDWWLIALVFAVLFLALDILRRNSEGAARRLDAALLRLPLMGPVLHKLALARFAHSFAILFQSGIGIPDSLRGAGVTLGNRALSAELDEAGRQLLAGRALSAALANLFPPFAVHMIRIGERSGQLGKALDDIAAACDRSVTEATGRLIGAMEPALTILIGGILAWIVLAVLGPIYSNLGAINAMM